MFKTLPAKSDFSLLLNGGLSMLAPVTPDAEAWARVSLPSDYGHANTAVILAHAAKAHTAGYSIGQYVKP